MTHTITKYLCDFCNREYKVEKNAVSHQQSCYSDPSNKACKTCRFYHHGFEERHYLANGNDVCDEQWDSGCEIDKMPYNSFGEAEPTIHCEDHKTWGQNEQ
jgi:hypothetical protein